MFAALRHFVSRSRCRGTGDHPAGTGDHDAVESVITLLEQVITMPWNR